MGKQDHLSKLRVERLTRHANPRHSPATRRLLPCLASSSSEKAKRDLKRAAGSAETLTLITIPLAHEG